MSLIGIVTVLYNSETVVEEFFETLNNQTFKDFVLYVVDNNSPDNSLEKSKKLAKNCFFKTIFIENSDNYGVAKGNNIGIKKSLEDGCDYVLLSNNDIYLENNTIELLLKNVKNDNAKLAVPKIYYYNCNINIIDMNKIEVNAKLQYAFGGLPLSKAQKQMLAEVICDVRKRCF